MGGVCEGGGGGEAERVDRVRDHTTRCGRGATRVEESAERERERERERKGKRECAERSPTPHASHSHDRTHSPFCALLLQSSGSIAIIPRPAESPEWQTWRPQRTVSRSLGHLVWPCGRLGADGAIESTQSWSLDRPSVIRTTPPPPYTSHSQQSTQSILVFFTRNKSWDRIK